MDKDPWIHRSKNMSCQSCMWFLKKAKLDASYGTLGRCRKHAPTTSGFPAVFIDDWCGDHKIDEEKL